MYSNRVKLFGKNKNTVHWIDGQGVLQGDLFWPTLPDVVLEINFTYS